MPRKSTKVVDYKVGSGNVYADLGFPDSAEMLAKARIVAQIGRIIQAPKLTQAEAGELLSIDQPKVSALLRGHFRGYSQERLINFLTCLCWAPSRLRAAVLEPGVCCKSLPAFRCRAERHPSAGTR